MRYGNAVVTWAIPVQAHLLGARLETYVETKATISTLRLCAQNGNPSKTPLAKVPFELMEIIVGHIQHPFFEKYLHEWERISDCMSGRFHEKHYCEEHDEVDHDERIERHHRKLGIHPGLSKEGEMFWKCRKVGLLPSWSMPYC